MTDNRAPRPLTRAQALENAVFLAELCRTGNVREAARCEHRAVAPSPHEPSLPDLAQVTGWSRAGGKPAFDENRALFGGWQIMG